MITEYLYVPLLVFIVAQAMKFSLAMLRGEYRPSLLFSSGGMPSVHSATVASLAMVALIEGGVSSPLFGIAGVFAAIVMYDSLGVRRAAGEQAKVLNVLIEDLSASGTVKTPRKYGHLREVLGHRPLEVLVGVMVGVLLTVLILLNQVFSHAPWLLTTPPPLAQTIELALAAFLIVSTAIMLLIARHRRAHSMQRYMPFFRQMIISNLTVAALFGILVFIQKQAVPTYSNWLFVCIVLLILILWHAALWYLLLVDGKLRKEIKPSEEMRKDRWLKKSKRKTSAKK